MPGNEFTFHRRHLLFLLIVAVALYILLPQFSSFRNSWHLLGHPRRGFIAVAVCLTMITYVFAAASYYFLSFRPLRFWRTVLVQLAIMFINRLLPAGIGAVGGSYLYLRHERHTPAEATAAVAANNLLGLLGHGLLLSVALLALHGGRTPLFHHLSLRILAVLAVLLSGGTIATIVFGRVKLAAQVRSVKRQLQSYRSRRRAIAGALAASILLTLSNILCLVYCLHAIHLSLPPVSVLLIFTVGIGAAAAVPTPGGLGGFEAGLAAGFIAYGLNYSSSLAVALLYRLVSYWLPLAVGAVAFLFVQRSRWLEPTSKTVSV